MELTVRIRKKFKVASWRIRYWWLDTQSGAVARVSGFCMAVLIVILQLINVAVASLSPLPPGEPRKAVYWWVVQLVIAVVSAIVAYTMRPKTEKPKPQAGEAPVVNDGLAARHVGGTVWIDDSFLLAWKVVKTTAIKTKGGKK